MEDCEGQGEGNEQKVEKIPVAPEDMNGREAFFALMAMKMMELAKKYHRKLEDMHSLFFMMSCDFQLLEQMLEAQANENMPTG